MLVTGLGESTSAILEILLYKADSSIDLALRWNRARTNVMVNIH